jgi:hypothetical protein
VEDRVLVVGSLQVVVRDPRAEVVHVVQADVAGQSGSPTLSLRTNADASPMCDAARPRERTTRLAVEGRLSGRGHHRAVCLVDGVGNAS